MTDDGRLPRCCESHADWDVLGEHLLKDFPTVAPERVRTLLERHHAESTMFVLPEADRLQVVELIVRSELAQFTGIRTATARLDPEDHKKPRRP